MNDAIDVRDGTHDSPKDAEGANTYPLVTSKDFINGGINFTSARRISATDYENISRRSLVEKYDILFSMIGGNLGNQVMVTDDRPFSVKNVALFKYYSKNLTRPQFIKRLTEHIALDLQSKAAGGAQPFVSLGFLRNMVVALPPLAEQDAITKATSKHLTHCESLEKAIRTKDKHEEKLCNAVVNAISA